VVASAVAPEVPGWVYNVGSGVATRVRQVIEELVGIAGFTGVVEEDGSGSSRSSDVPWQQADLRAITRDLGWRPEIDFSTSLRDGWHTER
jgi:nucleoside-diphosphate-sugar epimerase